MNRRNGPGHRRHLGVWVATLVAIALFAVGCGGGDGGSGDSDSGPIRMGAAISMSGELAEFGEQLREGYEIWQKQVNSKGGLMVDGKRRRVEIEFRDDQSDATTATNLVQQFISQDGIKLILGPYSSAIGLQVSTITEKNRAVMMISGGTADEIFERGYERIFAVWPLATMVTGQLIRVVHELDPSIESVALVVQDDLFSQAAAEGARQEAKRSGLDIALDETYPADITDFSSVVGKARSSGADYFAEFGHLDQAIGIVQQAKQLNYRPRAWSLMPGPETPEFREALGSSADGVLWYALWGSELEYDDPVFGDVQGYVTAYEKEFGHPPSFNSASATGAAEVLGLAIEKAGSTDPDRVTEALHQYSGTTLNGRIEFDPSGYNKFGADNMVFYQIQDGENVVLRPKSAQQGEPIVPLPPWEG